MGAKEDIHDQDQEPTTEEPAIDHGHRNKPWGVKDILVDIQISISNIFLENKSIRNELAQLTTTVREQKLEIAHLKTSLTNATKQCVNAEYELAAAEKRVNEQQDEIIIWAVRAARQIGAIHEEKFPWDTWRARERPQHDWGGSIEFKRSARSSYYSSRCRNFPQVETERKQTNNC